MTDKTNEQIISVSAYKRKETIRNYATAALFLAPFMVLYIWFWIYPIIQGFITSLTTGSYGVEQNFVGLSNYAYMLTDNKFWVSFGNTLYFILISTPTIVVLGLIMALIVNSKLKGTTILRSAFFMPYMLSISVVGSIWVFILQSRTEFARRNISAIRLHNGNFMVWKLGDGLALNPDCYTLVDCRV